MSNSSSSSACSTSQSLITHRLLSDHITQCIPEDSCMKVNLLRTEDRRMTSSSLLSTLPETVIEVTSSKDAPNLSKSKKSLITDISENDVLLGRGTTIDKNDGNIRFRMLIREFRPIYATSCQRQAKHNVAVQIRQVITQRKGRFLRKIQDDDPECEEKQQKTQMAAPLTKQSSSVFYEEVDEDTVLNKIKQALRDQAERNVNKTNEINSCLESQINMSHNDNEKRLSESQRKNDNVVTADLELQNELRHPMNQAHGYIGSSLQSLAPSSNNLYAGLGMERSLNIEDFSSFLRENLEQNVLRGRGLQQQCHRSTSSDFNLRNEIEQILQQQRYLHQQQSFEQRLQWLNQHSLLTQERLLKEFILHRSNYSHTEPTVSSVRPENSSVRPSIHNISDISLLGTGSLYQNPQGNIGYLESILQPNSLEALTLLQHLQGSSNALHLQNQQQQRLRQNVAQGANFQDLHTTQLLSMINRTGVREVFDENALSQRQVLPRGNARVEMPTNYRSNNSPMNLSTFSSPSDVRSQLLAHSGATLRSTSLTSRNDALQGYTSRSSSSSLNGVAISNDSSCSQDFYTSNLIQRLTGTLGEFNHPEHENCHKAAAHQPGIEQYKEQETMIKDRTSALKTGALLTGQLGVLESSLQNPSVNTINTTKTTTTAALIDTKSKGNRFNNSSPSLSSNSKSSRKRSRND